MSTYFKAVRPDGTDFYSGTIDYAAALGGEPVTLPKVLNPRCCTKDVLHASTVPTETLVGGAWPWRRPRRTGRTTGGRMTTYKPTKGERAVLYGTATGSVTLMIADSLPKFDVVGSYEPGGSLLYNPFLRHGTQVVDLDQDTRDWVWQTILEAKHRHDEGEPCEDMATHHIDTSGHLPHIAPIHQENE